MQIHFAAVKITYILAHTHTHTWEGFVAVFLLWLYLGQRTRESKRRHREMGDSRGMTAESHRER